MRNPIQNFLSVILTFCISMAHAAATDAAISTTTKLQPRSCYGGKIAAPPVRSQTLVLVDRTAYKDLTAWRDFQSGVAVVAQQTAQRIVLLTFAGIAPGQTLARALDVVIEPMLPAEAAEEYVVKDFRTSQACVKKRNAALSVNLQKIMEDLQVDDVQPMARSEIAYAIDRTLKDFLPAGLPTRILIYSDGLQHGSGMSFYSAGQPRDINPAQEIKLLHKLNQSGLQASSPSKAGADVCVFWWGLLSTTQRTRAGTQQSNYLNAQILAHYVEFWTLALTERGVTAIDIGPTLNNPALLVRQKP